MNSLKVLFAILGVAAVAAAPASDLVQSMPGWSPKTWPYDLYSPS